jgi:hypothetical protein
MGFPPRVALTTEYRRIRSHRLNARFPVLDLAYFSRSFTLLKKRAIRFFVFLGLFITSHPSAWKLQHSPALYALREQRFSVLKGIFLIPLPNKIN